VRPSVVERGSQSATTASSVISNISSTGSSCSSRVSDLSASGASSLLRPDNVKRTSVYGKAEALYTFRADPNNSKYLSLIVTIVFVIFITILVIRSSKSIECTQLTTQYNSFIKNKQQECMHAKKWKELMTIKLYFEPMLISSSIYKCFFGFR